MDLKHNVWKPVGHIQAKELSGDGDGCETTESPLKRTITLVQAQ